MLHALRSEGRLLGVAASTCIFASLLGLSSALFAVPPTPEDVRIIGIEPGRYQIHWIGFGGDFEYEIQRREDDGAFASLDTVGPVDAGGTGVYEDIFELNPDVWFRVRTLDPNDNSESAWSPLLREPAWQTSDDFRIFFNLEGAGCPEFEGVDNCVSQIAVVNLVDYIEDLFIGADVEFSTLGFNTPNPPLSADKYPINLKDCDGGGCARSWGIGLRPGLLGLYDPDTNSGTPFSLLVSVHEWFHKVQSAHGGASADPARKWITEGQARAIQDLVCVPHITDDCWNVDDDPSGSANYFGEVNGYLGSPNRPINEISYSAALFWTFLCQEYGSDQTEPHRGLDFMQSFWDEAETGSSERDGIQVIDATLQNIGSSDTFVDAFQQFIVTNYTKDFSDVPDSYGYRDEEQDPGSYDEVKRTTDVELAMSDQVGPFFDDVTRWGARYHVVEPDSSVNEIAVEFHSLLGQPPASYAVLAMRDGEIVSEERIVTSDLSRAIANPGGDPLDAVAVVVSGLESDVNYSYSFNATDPTMRIIAPSSSRRAYVQAGAAGKFVIQVEFLNPDATPLEGVDPDDVTFNLEGTAVTDVIQSLHVGAGQYWFVVSAPGLGTGLYDLEADWSSISAVNGNAVRYGSDAAPSTVNAIVVDRTPSMAGAKVSAARAAAKIYADSFSTGDRFAITSFLGDGDEGCIDETNFALSNWSEANRDDAHDAIDAMNVPSGKTSMGAGLLSALDEIESDSGDEDDPRAIFLLSDGLNNCGETLDDFLAEYEAREDAGDPVPAVHPVAIGADANRPDLRDLANATGGIPDLFVPDGTAGDGAGAGLGDTDLEFRWGLIDMHRLHVEDILGEERIQAGSGGGGLEILELVELQVDQGATELVVTLSWTEGRPLSTLRAPGAVAGVDPVLGSSRHSLWRIFDPQPGTWQLQLVGDESCPAPTSCPLGPYYVEASVRSSLGMEATFGLRPEDREVGVPMPILAALADAEGVPGADVTAFVRHPLGVSGLVTLHDDGLHGDGPAGDGVYGGTYYATTTPGTYLCEVIATGSTVLLGDFVRRRPLAFYLAPGPNSDGDCTSRFSPAGLPDQHEARTGTDPNRDDGFDDPDGDGKTTCQEFWMGTHPTNPDSDNDGEDDGSETDHGRDPLDPSDGTIDPPAVCAYALDSAVLLRFNRPRGADAFRLDRAEGRDGEFEVLVPTLQLSRVARFVDQRVRNDRLYRYRMVSLGAQGARSRPSEECSATPRRDPNAPHGSIRLNDGASTTRDLVVRVDLYASDRFDPEDAHADDRFFEDAFVSGVRDMKVSNRSDLDDAEWEPYQEEIPEWDIDPNARGIATVYAVFRDRAGNVSERVAASIRLVTEEPICGIRDLRFESNGERTTLAWNVEGECCLGWVLERDGEVIERGERVREVRVECVPAEYCVRCIDARGQPIADSEACLRVTSRDCGGAETGLQIPQDCNQDGLFNISDGICLLGHLFQGTPARLPCGEGTIRDRGNVGLLDCSGDGRIDLTDAICSFQWLFLGGRVPAGCVDRQCRECIELPQCESVCAQ